MSSDGAIEAVQSELCIDGIINCGAGDLGLMILILRLSHSPLARCYKPNFNEEDRKQLTAQTKNVKQFPAVTILLSR